MVSKPAKLEEKTQGELWRISGELQRILKRNISLEEVVEFLIFLSEKKLISKEDILEYGNKK